MNTLSKLIEELKISQAVKLTYAGLKRSKDIQESFDICINIVMDFACDFERERVKAYHEGKQDGKNEMKSKLNEIIQQLEGL
jgi:transposase